MSFKIKVEHLHMACTSLGNLLQPAFWLAFSILGLLHPLLLATFLFALVSLPTQMLWPPEGFLSPCHMANHCSSLKSQHRPCWSHKIFPDPILLPAAWSGALCIRSEGKEREYVMLRNAQRAFSKCWFPPPNEEQLWTLSRLFLGCLSEFIHKMIPSFELSAFPFLVAKILSILSVAWITIQLKFIFWNTLISPLFWDKRGLIYPLT